MPSPSTTSGDKPVAVVTASTAGIGLSIAHSLAADGFHVVVSSRKADNVQQALHSLHAAHGTDCASGIPCHVSNASDRHRLLDFALSHTSTTKIHSLVLNAAASTTVGPILKTSEAEWDKMFDVNVKSGFLLLKSFEKHITHSVTFISSIAAYNPIPGVGVYSVTKTALLGLTKILSNELAPRGVRVNCVAPGIIKTKFSEPLWLGKNSLAERAVRDTEKAKGSANLFHIPLRRLGEAEDIGGVVAFLVSDKAAYITGENIVVAGGALSKL